MNIFKANKNIGFLCVRMYLFILYYALLSQNFEHFTAEQYAFLSLL